METDGTYRVGTDIIANNISTGPQVVTIQPSAAAFLTRSCQPWQKAEPPKVICKASPSPRYWVDGAHCARRVA
jgi:hypothetical protein